ncbi:MAG: 1-(5-phosphoribosyl)-5-[(5-phosphoribosylamino)methylideneamino]imidazole-4-carboxamide isomerase [Acholeplasma sp.]|jgi:phosphoribosylformimino-5-aminoimidazole carboxamide ribotide isomerase|nr:MAG: 1-(5-phosphoribosyl)-5-[(5-phosphoribosylamino)methylideneamino]imidazole-4-carboxamide isomerase [Acholeplasma sp.]
MIIYPAIDLKNGRCVRLSQGDFNQEKVYDLNPVDVAKCYQKDGALALHIIDLNGAESGELVNKDVIESIIKEVKLPIQIGGGIRSYSIAKTWLDLGVKRVIIGTAVLSNDALLDQLLSEYKDRIAVSIDAKDGMVTTHGWTKTTSVDAYTLAKSLEEKGLTTLIFTDIAKDGMLSGPSFKDYTWLKENTSMQIIASGGITTRDDVIVLKQLGLDGAIIGKAIYEKRLSLKEVLAC